MVSTEQLYMAAQRSNLLTRVRVGALTVHVAFRAPDASVFDGLALLSDYQIEYPASWMALAQGDELQIDTATYRVREVRAIGDGSERRAALSKV